MDRKAGISEFLRKINDSSISTPGSSMFLPPLKETDRRSHGNIDAGMSLPTTVGGSRRSSTSNLRLLQTEPRANRDMEDTIDRLKTMIANADSIIGPKIDLEMQTHLMSMDRPHISTNIPLSLFQSDSDSKRRASSGHSGRQSTIETINSQNFILREQLHRSESTLKSVKEMNSKLESNHSRVATRLVEAELRVKDLSFKNNSLHQDNISKTAQLHLLRKQMQSLITENKKLKVYLEQTDKIIGTMQNEQLVVDDSAEPNQTQNNRRRRRSSVQSSDWEPDSSKQSNMKRRHLEKHDQRVDTPEGM